MSRTLHNLVLEAQAQTQAGGELRRRLTAEGALGADTGIVEAVASEPGIETIRLEFKGPFAQRLRAEFAELAEASGFEQVAYFDDSAGSTPDDGYVTVEEVPLNEPADPRTTLFQTVELELRRVGTRASHRRAIRTDVSDPTTVSGSLDRATVGLPAAAERPRWLDPATAAAEPASPVATTATSDGDVERFDATAASYQDPVLVADVPLADDAPTACHVWDDRGHQDKTDANGVVQWQKVFSPAHQPRGSLVVSTRALRVRFDVENGSISAEQWDDTAGAWVDAPLGDPGGYDLVAADLRYVGPQRVDIVAPFDDGGGPEVLEFRFIRGADGAFTTTASGSSSLPSDLFDLLEGQTSITSDEGQTATAQADLIERSRLR